jgi:hypothetical protein
MLFLLLLLLLLLNKNIKKDDLKISFINCNYMAQLNNYRE